MLGKSSDKGTRTSSTAFNVVWISNTSMHFPCCTLQRPLPRCSALQVRRVKRVEVERKLRVVARRGQLPAFKLYPSSHAVPRRHVPPRRNPASGTPAEENSQSNQQRCPRCVGRSAQVAWGRRRKDEPQPRAPRPRAGGPVQHIPWHHGLPAVPETFHPFLPALHQKQPSQVASTAPRSQHTVEVVVRSMRVA